jgi:hypothetical protein
MPGKRDYMPKKDSGFFGFQGPLVNKVQAKKADWGIPDAAVEVLANHRAIYEPLYYKVQELNRRTRADVIAHRHERKVYERAIRAFVNAHIRFNDRMTNTDRLSIGVPPPDRKPSPKPKINDIPLVGLTPLGGGSIKVTCLRTTDRDRPSMHKDADAIEVMFFMAPAQPMVKPKDFPPPEECPGSRISTKAQFIIRCGAKNAGLRFYGFFRWANLVDPDNSGSWTNVIIVVIA